MNDSTRSSLGSLVVRAARSGDNEALLALVRRCPMQADISLTIERDPDFFALSRARGDTHTFIAEIDGALAGCLSAWRRGAWLGGQPATICYVGDLRVSPEHRLRGVARQMGIAMRDFQGELPVVPIFWPPATETRPSHRWRRHSAPWDNRLRGSPVGNYYRSCT